MEPASLFICTTSPCLWERGGGGGEGGGGRVGVIHSSVCSVQDDLYHTHTATHIYWAGSTKLENTIHWYWGLPRDRCV